MQDADTVVRERVPWALFELGLPILLLALTLVLHPDDATHVFVKVAATGDLMAICFTVSVPCVLRLYSNLMVQEPILAVPTAKIGKYLAITSALLVFEVISYILMKSYFVGHELGSDASDAVMFQMEVNSFIAIAATTVITTYLYRIFPCTIQRCIFHS